MFTPSEVHAVQQNYGLPPFFDQNELTPPPSPSPTAFAAGDRNLPIHSKSACWMSTLRFFGSATLDDKASPEAAEALLKAAAFWGIQDETQKALQKVGAEIAELEAGLPDSAFALNTQSPDGMAIRLYPAVDPATTMLAADTFAQDAPRYPLEWRRKAAAALREKAAQFNVDLSEEVGDYLEQAAGNGVASSQGLAATLRKRASYLSWHRKTEEAEELLKVASHVEKMEPSVKLSSAVAGLLDKVDRAAGLHRLYGSTFSLPEQDCHAVLQKHAAAWMSDHLCLPNGSVYAVADLKKVARDISATLPLVKTASLSEDLSKLSAAEAGALEHVLRDRGLEPVDVPPAVAELLR
jgi:hypothetical protein